MGTVTHRPAENVSESPSAQRRLWFQVGVLLAVGFLMSAELTRIHVGVHVGTDVASMCAVSEEVNCETVARSPYAVFFGIPVSVWGMIAYLLIAALAAPGIRQQRSGLSAMPGMLLLASVPAAVAAAVLAYIAHVRIGAICPFCMALYVVNALLLLASVLLLRAHRKGPLSAVVSDLRTLRSHPRFSTGLGFIAAALVVGSVLMIPPYWQHIGFVGVPDLPSGVDARGEHWTGAADAIVTIREFSDYQCPYCRQAHRDARLLISRFSGKVRLIHRHIPMDHHCNPNLTTIRHLRSCEFAYAVECAGSQNRYWEMNDAVFAIQDTVTADEVNLHDIGRRLKMDMKEWEACMSGDDVRRKIQSHIEEAYALHIDGTPTFFAGHLRSPGRLMPRILQQAIEHAESSSP